MSSAACFKTLRPTSVRADALDHDSSPGPSDLSSLLQAVGIKGFSEVTPLASAQLEQPASAITAMIQDDIQVLTNIFRYITDDNRATFAAKALISRFGSIGAVFTASPKRAPDALPEISDCIHFLKTIYDALVLFLRRPVENQAFLGSWSAVEAYLKVTMAHEENEVSRVFFLNTRNLLIADEEHSRGTVNFTPINLRELARRVCETNAAAIILVHNHPSGDLQPSDADIDMTYRIKRVLKELDVVLHDHIIVGKHGCTSFRRLGLL